MRRKAQVTVVPMTNQDPEAEMIAQFLAEVNKMGQPIPEGGPVPGGAAGINDELAVSEMDEHVAFTEITQAIELLKNAVAALREHEQVEKEHETDTKADKKESKAIAKLEKAIEEVSSACEELCEAEKEEHEEKEEPGDVEVVEVLAETAEAAKEPAKEETKEEKKEEPKKEEASLKVRSITASKKEADIDDSMLADLL